MGILVVYKGVHGYIGVYLTIIPGARMGSESIAHDSGRRPNGLLTQGP